MSQRRVAAMDYGVCPGCGADLTEEYAILVTVPKVATLSGSWDEEERVVKAEVEELSDNGNPVVRCASCGRLLRAKSYQKIDDESGYYTYR